MGDRKTEQEKELLRTRAKDVVVESIGRMWKSVLKESSGLKNSIENTVNNGGSNKDILEVVQAHQPSVAHSLYEREGDETKRVGLWTEGVNMDNPTDDVDSLYQVSLGLLGGEQALQERAKEIRPGMMGMRWLHVPIDEKTGMEASFRLQDRAKSILDPPKWAVSEVGFSVPESKINVAGEKEYPGADIVAGAIRSALSTPAPVAS